MSFDAYRPPAGTVRIEGFKGGKFVVDGEARDGAILIWPGGVVSAAEEIADAVFDPMLRCDPPLEVILIGTGSVLRWPDFDMLERLRGKGVGVEVMASDAAARTYNLLLAEGRQVGAYLLPI